VELTIGLPDGDERLGVVGVAEKNLKLIREALGVTIIARDGQLRLSGDSDAVGRAAGVLEQLQHTARDGKPMSTQDLLEAIASTGRGVVSKGSGVGSLDVYVSGRGISPMTAGQQAYLDAMTEHDLTFCCGPAGTGKTYLAVAFAVSLLRRNRIRKLVLVRPAVEAGERLGFLPGDMQEKVNPYLRPLLDALHDMMEFEQIQRFMACDLIEIIPLAFMRGRTLNDALIILDEAQNTTRNQMLMFLTRLGHGSKMIVTGDTTQIDLDDARDSGLVDGIRRLQKVAGVATVALEKSDIVRHNLVQRIVKAYETSGQPKRARATRSDRDDSTATHATASSAATTASDPVADSVT